MKKKILWLAADLMIAAFVILAVWIVNYKIPQKGIQAAAFPQMEEKRLPKSESQTEKETVVRSNSLTATKVVLDAQDWHEKFADKFTDTVAETDTSYTSPDVSVELFYSHYDTGKLDRSSEGKHIKYGTESTAPL